MPTRWKLNYVTDSAKSYRLSHVTCRINETARLLLNVQVLKDSVGTNYTNFVYIRFAEVARHLEHSVILDKEFLKSELKPESGYVYVDVICEFTSSKHIRTAFVLVMWNAVKTVGQLRII